MSLPRLPDYVVFLMPQFNKIKFNLLKVNSWNPRTISEICSKLTIKTPERRNCGDIILFLTLNNFTHCSGISIVEIEQVNAG